MLVNLTFIQVIHTEAFTNIRPQNIQMVRYRSLTSILMRCDLGSPFIEKSVYPELQNDRTQLHKSHKHCISQMICFLSIWFSIILNSRTGFNVKPATLKKIKIKTRSLVVLLGQTNQQKLFAEPGDLSSPTRVFSPSSYSWPQHLQVFCGPC